MRSGNVISISEYTICEQIKNLFGIYFDVTVHFPPPVLLLYFGVVVCISIISYLDLICLFTQADNDNVLFGHINSLSGYVCSNAIICKNE